MSCEIPAKSGQDSEHSRNSGIIAKVVRPQNCARFSATESGHVRPQSISFTVISCFSRIFASSRARRVNSDTQSPFLLMRCPLPSDSSFRVYEDMPPRLSCCLIPLDVVPSAFLTGAHGISPTHDFICADVRNARNLFWVIIGIAVDCVLIAIHCLLNRSRPRHQRVAPNGVMPGAH